MDYQFKTQFKNRLISFLEKGRYTRIYIKDGEDLIKNFREQLNIFNMKI